MTRPAHPPLLVVSISMADGTDINSPEARERIARALLSIPTTHPVPSAREQARPA